MQSFDIHFRGKLLADADAQQVRAAIGKLFKVEGKALDRLFSGEAIRIKKDVDVDAANRFREIFRQAGALVEIVPHGHALAETAQSSTKTPAKASMTLLPANSGTLEDCAAPIQAQEIPDISGMGLDAIGATLDESPQPATAKIDISALSVEPANTGSLEDCQIKQTDTIIPDISHIQLDDSNETP